MAYRQSFEACPRCRATLEDAGAVRACTECRGQWVVEPVLAEMVIAMLPPGVVGKLSLVPMRGTRKGPCPSCGIEMESVGLHGVELERCPKDHGVWFDPDELQAGLLRSADPAHEPSTPEDPAYRMENLTLTAPEPLEPPPAEPARPIIEPSISTPEGNRPVVPGPSIDDVVNRLMRGAEVRVGGDKYRWDTALHRIVVEGAESRVISDVELSRVVDAYPDLFSAPPAPPKLAKLADVIARMKRGETFTVGCSRAFDTYGWDHVTSSLYSFYQEDTYEHARCSLSESRLAELIDKEWHRFT